MVKCIGVVNESKCSILEKDVTLGLVPVCKRIEGFITIKNLQK